MLCLYVCMCIVGIPTQIRGWDESISLLRLKTKFKLFIATYFKMIIMKPLNETFVNIGQCALRSRNLIVTN